MKSLLLAAAAALLCSPALAGDFQMPEVGQHVVIQPPGAIICDTLDQVRAIAADTNKPEAFMDLMAAVNKRGEPTCMYGGGGGTVSEVVTLPDYDMSGLHIHPFAVLVVSQGIDRWILLPVPERPAPAPARATVVPGKGA